MNKIEFGDCRATMRRWAAEGVKVQTCVTSPPYFGLRDYGHEGQLGLEPTPDEFVANLVEVFRCVRDVLADDGTLWLNIGDSYNTQPPGNKTPSGFSQTRPSRISGNGDQETVNTGRQLIDGLKKKDLIGIPWMLAFALRADGWYLRQDIIWHKPNPMPESVRDRCTKAHEYVFLLSKSERYYFDAEAIKEQSNEADRPQRRRAIEISKAAGLTQAHFDAIRACGATDAGKNQVTQDGYMKNAPEVQRLADEAKAALGGYYREFTFSEQKNKRSVWTVATRPYKGAHFATFPPALIEPCILAGSRPGDVVLDPFMGSGTTAAVSVQHGRKYLGCELNPEYKALQDQRIEQNRGLFDAS